MLKQTAAFLLLLCFAAQTFSHAAIVGSYYANTTAYARNCINKAKPRLHCNGKCQMMKKLKQEEKKEQQDPESRAGGKEQVLSSKSFFASLTMHTHTVHTCYRDEKPAPLADQPSSIFHPPGK